jgi:hypothetical protein
MNKKTPPPLQKLLTYAARFPDTTKEKKNPRDWTAEKGSRFLNNTLTTDQEGYGCLEHDIVETCIKLARTRPVLLPGFKHEDIIENNTCISATLSQANVTPLTRLWQGSATAFGTLWEDKSANQIKPQAPIQVTFKLVPGVCAYTRGQLKDHDVDPALGGFLDMKKMQDEWKIVNFRREHLTSKYYNNIGWSEVNAAVFGESNPDDSDISMRRYFYRVARTHPTNIFIGSVQIDSEVMRCTYDNYDIFQNQWFGACYFLGDLWREKNTTTAISIDGLNEERGPVPVLTETCVGRGIMKCDSNDAYLDRGLANTKYNKYPEHKASVHNNNELLVSDGDINYKFDPKGLGKGRCEDIFPPTDHDLALSHNILTIGVHGKGAGEALRDQKIWTSVGLADDV